MRRTLAAVVFLLAVPLDAGGRAMPDAMPVYKKVGDVALKLHVFRPAGHPLGDRRPAIVFFHGGGWQHGSPRQFYDHCRYLASRGMVAMTAEYRVKNEHGTSPRECVQDAKSAVRWIRRHADDLGVDPDRLAAGGGSAGGQMAAACGSSEGLNDPADDLEISCRPNAVILFSAVLDTGPDGFVHNWVRKYWRDFSPIDNIDEQTPPTLIFLGTDDGITPVETARRYEKRMQEAGVRCDLHLYENQPHRFYVRHISESYYRQTLVTADRFLASLGFLEGEPTLELEEPAPGEP
jgi:acetyl esterase/lipase